MEDNIIKRINELSHLSKERELTAEELAEQTTLRESYLARWRKSVASVLENTFIVDETGNKRPLKRKIK